MVSGTQFPFARRTDWQQEPNSLNKALEELKAHRVPVFDLTASNPTECGFAYPKSIISALASVKNLQYHPQAAGMPHSRQAVAKYYERQGVGLPAQDIVLTASTSEAYSFLMRLLVNPGERVLIPKPSYPLFTFLLEINDVQFDHYPLVYDGHWHLDREALKRLVDARTRAIILVNPNNPTGSYISPADLCFLSELCLKHKMAIISDEVFFEYGLERGDLTSCAGNAGALTFTLGGLSKTMALPQMKAAWILASGPEGVLRESLSRLEIIADTYLSVNTPVQNALSVWLKQAPKIQKAIMDRVTANLSWLKSHVAVNSEVLSVQGGWYANLRIPAVKSEEEWVLEFLKEDHVAVYPGYFFDFEKEAYIVISLLPREAVFKKACGRLMKTLAKCG